MYEIQISKNKTEDLMFDVTSKLKNSKNKYFVITKPSRGAPYVDYRGDEEFLKSIKDQIDHILSRINKD